MKLSAGRAWRLYSLITVENKFKAFPEMPARLREIKFSRKISVLFIDINDFAGDFPRGLAVLVKANNGRKLKHITYLYHWLSPRFRVYRA